MKPMDTQSEEFFQRVAIEVTLRIALIAGLALWCFNIVLPFVEPTIWAMIIAVATYPMFRWFRDRVLRGHNKLAAGLFVVLMLMIVLIPSIALTQSLFDTVEGLMQEFQLGNFDVPPPSERVRSWPLIGESAYESWRLASENLGDVLVKAEPLLREFAGAIFDTAVGAGLGMVQSFLSIIIAGVLLAYGYRATDKLEILATRLAGGRGVEFSRLAAATVRSVARGVLGVALIQALCAGVGMLAIGVPGAGFWAFLVLMLAVVQLPPLLVLGPVIAYVFSAYDTLPAVLFTIWSLIISVSDSFLKPLLLGRGVSVPMAVIFIGAIGGFMLTGIIGLFTGAVIFVLGYTLFVAWLHGPVTGSAESDVAS